MSAKSFFAIAALFATTIVHAHSFMVGDIEIADIILPQFGLQLITFGIVYEPFKKYAL